MVTKARNQVVLKIGAEGGSLTLLGRKTAGGSWRFCMERNEWAIKDLLSEEDAQGMSDDCFYEKSGWVSSFSEALDLISKYDWHELYPEEIHPDFRDMVFAEVYKRGGPEAVKRWNRILERHNREGYTPAS